MAYRLYALDNTTPIDIAQPAASGWQTVVVGTRPKGTQRVSRFKRVRWTFARLTEDEYQVFVQSRPPDGVIQFDTWKRATGGVHGTFVKCAGVMAETIPGALRDGEYTGVTVVFIAVEEV